MTVSSPIEMSLHSLDKRMIDYYSTDKDCRIFFLILTLLTFAEVKKILKTLKILPVSKKLMHHNYMYYNHGGTYVLSTFNTDDS